MQLWISSRYMKFDALVMYLSACIPEGGCALPLQLIARLLSLCLSMSLPLYDFLLSCLIMLGTPVASVITSTPTTYVSPFCWICVKSLVGYG